MPFLWPDGFTRVPEDVIGDRLEIMRTAMDRVFNNAFEFGASWTYITCEPRA